MQVNQRCVSFLSRVKNECHCRIVTSTKTILLQTVDKLLSVDVSGQRQKTVEYLDSLRGLIQSLKSIHDVG